MLPYIEDLVDTSRFYKRMIKEVKRDFKTQAYIHSREHMEYLLFWFTHNLEQIRMQLARLSA